MRPWHFFVILLLLAMMPCCMTSGTSNNLKQSENDGNECDTIVLVAGQRVCLPQVLGMQECSSHPAIQTRRGFHVTDASTTIGVYLTDSLASRLSELDSIALDEFVKLYTVQKTLDFDIDHDQIVQLSEMLNSQHIRKNWESSIGRPLRELFSDIAIDKYLIIENYSPRRNIMSTIYLTRMQNDNVDYDEYLAMNLSLCIIKGKLIWSAYYLQYDDRSTIEELKKRSDYFNLRLLQDNLD